MMSLGQQRGSGLTSVTNSSVRDMNSIYSAVINVFRGEGLQMSELYFLNESIRWLLKTEMGSFIEEYFQNQLLNKGLGSILEEVQLHEGEGQLLFLADVWIRFLSEILPTLQAIFNPLQGHGFTVRQMTLLAFRDLVLMRLPLEELLPTNLALLPTPITQMLLILQGVHEPRGPSEEYIRLEKMLEKLISPYLWNCKHKSYEEDIKGNKHLIQPEIRITQHNSEVSLTPLSEQGEGHVERGCLRRHSVSDGRSVITDMQLLTVTSRTHSGLVEARGTVNKIREKAKRAHFQVNTIFESHSC